MGYILLREDDIPVNEEIHWGLVTADQHPPCAGQIISGCEAAVHSMREDFQEESAEAALLVDASHAFNFLNRMSALYNIRMLCPSIATREPTASWMSPRTTIGQI